MAIREYYVISDESKHQVNTYNDIINAASKAIAAAHDTERQRSMDIRLRTLYNGEDVPRVEKICLYIE